MIKGSSFLTARNAIAVWHWESLLQLITENKLLLAVKKLFFGNFFTKLDWLLFFLWVEILVLTSGDDALFLVLYFLKDCTLISV